jgi:hypothetical protein
MPIIHIRGRVLPLARSVTASDLQPIVWKESTHAKTMQFTVHIQNSVVDVECEMEDFHPYADFSVPMVRALELARAVVDCLAFSTGLGLSVVLDDIVSPAGVVKKIQFANPPLSSLCTAFDLTPGNAGPNNFRAMYNLVVAEPPLFLALNDLITAITVPGQIPINCARAVEGLRMIMVPNDPSRKLGWAKMRETLQLERTYLEYITEMSTNPRHGDKSHIDQHLLQEVLRRSWIVMNRFFEYRKRGNEPLPIADFPLLG